MAKAFLQQDTAKRVMAARKNSIDKTASANNSPTLPPMHPHTEPIPIPRAVPIMSSSPASSPSIQQVIIYPPVDNTALLKERADKEKAEELYRLEKAARERAEQQHREELERIKQLANEQVEAAQKGKERVEQLYREELERNKQLVQEDAALQQRTAEKARTDYEAIQRVTEEHEWLKQELERLKHANEESKLPPENIAKEQENEGVKPVPVPPPYDDADKSEPVELAAHNNEVPLTGEIALDTPVDDGSNDKCVVS